MWTGFWSFQREYLRQEPFDPENICFLSTLSLLSLGGLWRMFREGSPTMTMLYLLVLLVFPIPYYLSHLDPGFRHPVDPLLVLLACSTITRSRSFYPVTTSSGSRSSVACTTGMAHGAPARVYCLGEQPITRRKALPKALSDS